MVTQYELSDDPACEEYLATATVSDIIEGFNSIEPNSQSEFLSAVQHALKKSISILEQSANRYYALGEEELNSLVAGLLVGQSIDAETETNNRGNVDICVRFGEYKWHLEAKLGKTNNYIFEGLLQIITRYATKENDFGLLIYFQNKAPSLRFKRWVEYIDNQGWGDYAKKHNIYKDILEQIPDNESSSLFSDKDLAKQKTLVTSAGTDVNVQFFGVNLYHNPLDSSGRDGKGQALHGAKQAIQVEFLNHREGGEVDLEKLMFNLGVLFEHSKEFDNIAPEFIINGSK
ncbi:hypothetical protein AB6C88_17290 [Vibrio splendidus]